MKAKKKAGKKGDDELVEEMIANLKLDIDILEHDIHLEELREVQANKDYDDLILKTQDIQKDIENFKQDKDKDISAKSKLLSDTEAKKGSEILQLKDNIRQLEGDIERLKEEIEQNKEIYEEKKKLKDEEIAAQESLFRQMTTKFQNILQTTTSKLQERIKMGN